MPKLRRFTAVVPFLSEARICQKNNHCGVVGNPLIGDRRELVSLSIDKTLLLTILSEMLLQTKPEWLVKKLDYDRTREVI